MVDTARIGAVCLILIGVSLSGCQRKPVTAVRWPLSPSAAAGNPPTALVVRETGSPRIRVGQETVISRRTQVGGAYLRDSWTKNIRDARGQLIYADGRIYDSVPPKVQRQALDLSSKPEIAALVLKRLKQALPALASATWTRGPELELSPRERIPGWRLLWVVDYLDGDADVFKRIYASLRGKPLSVTTVSADYVDAPASVFPKGPKSSVLEDVILSGLLDQVGLASPRARVTCSDEPALLGWDKAERSFRFSPLDHRFDAVQAYYFVDRAQAWFREHAGIELPTPLTLDVFAGGTQSPRNTACYYYGIIRLGAGDGKTYHDLMRDPSVVMHEVSHAVIESISHLPTQDEGGSLNEAFADFFAANMLDSPRMGEVSYVPGPYKRNLDNNSVVADKNGSLYHDSLIVSGTLWEIRKALGSAKALSFALKALSRLNGDSKLDDFATACQFAIQAGVPSGDATGIQEVLAKRGWVTSIGAPASP